MRKRTVFNFCPAHHDFLTYETRQRRAEWVAEGGPADPCTGTGCVVKPGTDLFAPMTDATMEDLIANWYGNRPAAA